MLQKRKRDSDSDPEFDEEHEEYNPKSKKPKRKKSTASKASKSPKSAKSKVTWIYIQVFSVELKYNCLKIQHCFFVPEMVN